MNAVKRNSISYMLGVITGGVLVVVLMFVMMPKLMIVTHESKYGSIQETCDALQIAIEANGWVSPSVRNMNKSIEKQGVFMDKQVRIVELCNAQYAKDVLQTDPEVSTLMPCAWGVYEGDDGKIYISGMNMSLMGKMFGGNIAKVIGGAVATDEKNMLKEVL